MRQPFLLEELIGMQKPLAKETTLLPPKTLHLSWKIARQLWASVKTQTVLPQTAGRFGSHLVVVGLMLLAAILGGINLSAKQTHAAATEPVSAPVQQIAAKSNDAPFVLSGKLQNRNSGVLLPAPVPQTIIPDRTDHSPKIQTYTVQPGDTIIGIAASFGLQPETLQWSNPKLEDNPDLLMVGDELTILPVDGVYHQVASNETLDEIAGTLKVTAADIINYPLNNLDPENPVITPGQWLIVPGGEKPYVPKHVSAVNVNVPANATKGTGNFQWPTNGTITQEYWSGHRALDIGAWIGAPIYAADAGYVIYAGWDNSGYGNMVEINHGNGFITLYAHMNTIYVSVGDEVSKGQQIGEMGSTGHSTGPHLHFEVRLNGVQRNPWGFLP